MFTQLVSQSLVGFVRLPVVFRNAKETLSLSNNPIVCVVAVLTSLYALAKRAKMKLPTNSEQVNCFDNTNECDQKEQ